MMFYGLHLGFYVRCASKKMPRRFNDAHISAANPLDFLSSANLFIAVVISSILYAPIL